MTTASYNDLAREMYFDILTGPLYDYGPVRISMSIYSLNYLANND